MSINCATKFNAWLWATYISFSKTKILSLTENAQIEFIKQQAQTISRVQQLGTLGMPYSYGKITHAFRSPSPISHTL